MNREIKFRVWDKTGVEMINDNEFFQLADKTTGGCRLSDFFAVNKDGTVGKCAENIIFMQYTGLKDKNGKEIYEGDVIEWKYLNVWQRNEVKWIAGGFVSTMTAFKGDLNEMQNLSLISKLECEVIGNIYENPNLIKK